MPSQPAPVPPDDLSRELTVARPDQDQSLPHIGLVGDTYTILVTGEETAGKYTLIDMHVPPGGFQSAVATPSCLLSRCFLRSSPCTASSRSASSLRPIFGRARASA